MIRAIAPELLLPLSPSVEWTALLSAQNRAVTAPGCPIGVSAPTWRRLESLFGLGPLFPRALNALSEDELRYGLFRIGDTARMMHPFHERVSDLLTLWTANAMLRSREHRLWDGVDIPLVGILGPMWKRLQESARDSEENEHRLAICLQLAFASCTSPTQPDLSAAATLAREAEEGFAAMGATPLAALAELVRVHATGTLPSERLPATLVTVGQDPKQTNLPTVYHAVLDAAFPGPRLEATSEYHVAATTARRASIDAASTLKAGFSRPGEAHFDEQFWKRTTTTRTESKDDKSIR
jgi:hypothetical protein